jgi:hypothetical protein
MAKLSPVSCLDWWTKKCGMMSELPNIIWIFAQGPSAGEFVAGQLIFRLNWKLPARVQKAILHRARPQTHPSPPKNSPQWKFSPGAKRATRDWEKKNDPATSQSKPNNAPHHRRNNYLIIPFSALFQAEMTLRAAANTPGVLITTHQSPIFVPYRWGEF